MNTPQDAPLFREDYITIPVSKDADEVQLFGGVRHNQLVGNNAKVTLSDNIPAIFGKYMAIHEYICIADKANHGHCKRATEIELSQVPDAIKSEYIRYRIGVHSGICNYFRKHPESEHGRHILPEMEGSIAYLESFLQESLEKVVPRTVKLVTDLLKNSDVPAKGRVLPGENGLRYEIVNQENGQINAFTLVDLSTHESIEEAHHRLFDEFGSAVSPKNMPYFTKNTDPSIGIIGNIPEKFIPYVCFNEVHCLDCTVPNACLNALRIEVQLVSKDDLPEYFTWRIGFFENLGKYYAQHDDPESARVGLEMRNCAQYLKTLQDSHHPLSADAK